MSITQVLRLVVSAKQDSDSSQVIGQAMALQSDLLTV